MSLTYQEFQDNFVVSIRNFQSPHVDAAGSFDYAVGFNIVCKNNRRTNYFGKHLMSNDVPIPNATQNDVANVAWDILSTEVRAWASQVVGSSNLFESHYVPNPNANFQNSNITLSDYNSNFTTMLSRFDVYPASQPTCWCVGFNIINKNNTNIARYVDSQVVIDMFDNDKSEMELLDMGWSNVKEVVAEWAHNILHTSPLIVTEFTPAPWSLLQTW